MAADQSSEYIKEANELTHEEIIVKLLDELERVYRQPAWAFLRNTLCCGKTMAAEVAGRYGFKFDSATRLPLPALEEDEEDEDDE